VTCRTLYPTSRGIGSIVPIVATGPETNSRKLCQSEIALVENLASRQFANRKTFTMRALTICMTRTCPDCETKLEETDLETEKMRWICPMCAPEFVKAAAFDDYSGPYNTVF
jgi:hypothetical protein